METFADRLRFLMRELSVSAFARQVSLSESLIRKYLKGSEPSLSRAEQIARLANVNLQWLANGSGEPYRNPEYVNKTLLQLADQLVNQSLSIHVFHLPALDRMALTVAAYQFLQDSSNASGLLDEQGAQLFISHQIRMFRKGS